MKKIIISLIFLSGSSFGMKPEEIHIVCRISPDYSLKALNYFINQREIDINNPREDEPERYDLPINWKSHICLHACKLTAQQIKKDIELLHKAIENKNNKEIKQFALERTFIFLFENNNNKTANDLCAENQEIAPLLKEYLEKYDCAKKYRLKESV